MSSLHIVTDGGACFGNKRHLQQSPITIVPFTLEFGNTMFRDDGTTDANDLFDLLRTQRPPRLIPPTAEEYLAVYQRLKQQHQHIISIHTSRELSESWHNAREAVLRMGEDSGIFVLDSRTICAGQGLLVQVAAEAALSNFTLDESIKHVRGAVERIFSAYYVESLIYLQHNDILAPARTILGTMLGIKPFLGVEDGKLIVTEKVRTRAQALDRLVEFVSEFDAIDDAVIVQNRTKIMEQTRTLQENLLIDFPGRHFPYTIYSSALGALLGGDAIGVAILEEETKGFNNG